MELKKEIKRMFRYSDLKGNLYIFLGIDFLKFQTQNREWNYGQLYEGATIYQNCALTTVDPEMSEDYDFQFIMTGGYNNGKIEKAAVAYSFLYDDVAFTLNIKDVVSLPELSLQRYLHQTVIIRKNNGKYYLIVIGGKHHQSYWTNVVSSLELTPYLLGLYKKKQSNLED